MISDPMAAFYIVLAIESLYLGPITMAFAYQVNVWVVNMRMVYLLAHTDGVYSVRSADGYVGFKSDSTEIEIPLFWPVFLFVVVAVFCILQLDAVLCLIKGHLNKMVKYLYRYLLYCAIVHLIITPVTLIMVLVFGVGEYKHSENTNAILRVTDEVMHTTIFANLIIVMICGLMISLYCFLVIQKLIQQLNMEELQKQKTSAIDSTTKENQGDDIPADTVKVP